MNIKKFLSIIKSTPFQLFICICCAFLLGDKLSLETVQKFYTLSFLIKEALMIFLPVIIFSYIFAAIVSLEQRAPLLISTLLGFVVLSNAIAVLMSYGIGKVFLPFFHDSQVQTLLTATSLNIEPLVTFPFGQIITTNLALIMGLSLGLTFSILGKGKAFAINLRNKVTLFLKLFFIPLLPIYVFGFVLKMDHEGSLDLILHNYLHILLLICLSIIGYFAALLFIASGFNLRRACVYLRELMPPAMTAFSTMSSAATMPLTLGATEKNIKDREFADLVIPTTVNIHLLGDAVGVPLIGMSILLLSGHPLPNIATYLMFTVSFCLAKFSSAGVPGGGVIVLLPILHSHLGLTPEMNSLLTTLYILQDPLFTASNVVGNGIFAILSYKICKRFKIIKTSFQKKMA